MQPTLSNSEDFDPWSATVWGPGRALRPSGVPAVGTPQQLFQTRIKTPRGLYTTEKTNQQAPDSRSDCIIEVWNFGPVSNPTLGANLTSDMWIMHRGIRYDIVGKNDMQGDYRRQTTKYQCRICTNPVPVS